MIRSDSLDALSASLSAAQGSFQAIAKKDNNPFFKSKYAALPDVVLAAAPVLAEHGLAVWQGADTDETGEILWTVVLHSSGQFIGSSARLLPVKDDPQAQGSAITYQRRYQYMSALGLVADDDDDGNAASKARRAAPKVRSSAPAPNPPAKNSGETEPKPQDENSDPLGELVNQTSLDGLRKTFLESGKTHDELAWCLLSVGVTSLPANPSRMEIGEAMRGLSVDQALRLDSLLTDDGVPGSGESK